jgi:oligosaccharide translocation protein RFT1
VRLLKITLSFLKQSIFKFFLTEGEKFVLFYFGTMSNQGVYDLVANLGSVVARTVFQSVEEIGLTTWSKELGTNTEKGSKAIPTSVIQDSGRMLELLLKFCITLGSVFVFFGPAYTRTLLLTLYGDKWTSTEAPTVLSVYCIYVLFMAVNGVTEAFVHAASNREQLDRANYWMPVFSVLYLIFSYLGLSVFHYGTVSLVAANCLNMALRILYSTRFIESYFTQHNRKEPGKKIDLWKNSIPSWSVCLVFISTFIITNITGVWFGDSVVHRIIHITIGATCLGVLVISLRVTEKNFLTNIWRLFRGKKMD